MSNGIETLGHAAAALGDEAIFGCGVLTLALVFLLSSVPKIRRPELAALAMVDFGVVEEPRRRVGLGAGVGELTLALTLAFAATSSSAAGRLIPTVCGALVLWYFVALIARALRMPERFACFCFGNAESSISAWTMARTVGMALVATAFAAASVGAVPAGSLETWLLQFILAVSLVGTSMLISVFRPIQEVTA